MRYPTSGEEQENKKGMGASELLGKGGLATPLPPPPPTPPSWRTELLRQISDAARDGSIDDDQKGFLKGLVTDDMEGQQEDEKTLRPRILAMIKGTVKADEGVEVGSVLPPRSCSSSSEADPPPASSITK